MPTVSANVKRWVRLALVVLAVGGIVLTLWTSSRDAGGVTWPAAGTVALATLGVLALVVLGALSWVALLADHAHWLLLFRGYLAGQLAKYVPGGVLQVAGLYDFTRRAGVERRLAGVALPIAALVDFTAPGCVGAAVLGVIGTHLAWPVRLLLVVGGAVGTVLAVHRGAIAGLFTFLHRRWSRIPSGDVVPAQPVLLRSFLVAVPALVGYAVAFAVLLPHDDAHALAVNAGVFLLAFTIGFLALPVPSGIGIREAVLVAFLPAGIPTSTVLAASVVLRVVQLVVELAVAGAAFLAVHVHQPQPRVLVDDPAHTDPAGGITVAEAMATE